MQISTSDCELLHIRRSLEIKYFYTFDGTKLRQTVENSGVLTKVDYCGPFVYETASGVRSLKYIVTPEGRAVKNGSAWDYEYNLKDNLGNTCAVIKNNGGVAQLIQERHYYPFGMEMSELSSGTSTNKYQYNSKELQNDFNLYWYDYGARFYDLQLGRWHSIDPMAENYDSWSPYSYCYNNPARFIDPDGMEVILGGGEYGGDLYTGIDAQNLFRDLQTQSSSNNQDQQDDKKKGDDKKKTDDGKKSTDGTQLEIEPYNGPKVITGSPFDNPLFNLMAFPIGGIPNITKAVNTNIIHAIEQGVERGIFADKKEAVTMLKNLTSEISKNGFPSGAFKDPSKLDRVLVPVGNGGLAVYQVAKNGTAALKTVLIAR